MTPRGSWWQSTAERGGGLVCWLESLRAVRRGTPACDLLFTANSGHELGHLGLDDFVARRPGWDQADGAIWLQYGANIGAACAGVLTEAGARPGMAPKSQVASGETRDNHRAGGTLSDAGRQQRLVSPAARPLAAQRLAAQRRGVHDRQDRRGDGGAGGPADRMSPSTGAAEPPRSARPGRRFAPPTHCARTLAPRLACG
jgi:hypothetical protein